ncbi:tumor protein p53-inducible protein 11 [Limosa lapponica baueri]|uniref:Tumor protein p53-inducible protein 11 n=1 Tax=Limosa lapponica baueri TaxID=1758121 RepID=A0A2I0T1L0_LIMLA|nr:tumor protein p53-inducible protein 11 [Limosa lapponica baueri]
MAAKQPPPLMKKHSQTDLVSRLKTRKILGVGGEDDDGEVHRSKALAFPDQLYEAIFDEESAGSKTPIRLYGGALLSECHVAAPQNEGMRAQNGRRGSKSLPSRTTAAGEQKTCS